MWIVLRENKPNTQRKVLQELEDFLKLSIQTFVDLLTHHLLVEKKYFITFIDDFSRDCYIYLLHEKSQAMSALEVYIIEVERQLDRKVKVVRSVKGGEYYGRYDELGQCPNPFAKLLEKHGMCAQYTMPDTP